MCEHVGFWIHKPLFEMVLWTYYEFTSGHLLLKLESPLNTAEPCEALQMHLYTNIGAGLDKKILMMGLVLEKVPSEGS